LRLNILADRNQVRDFLESIKETISNPIADRGWVLVPRHENNECLSQLGFRYPEIQEALLGLSVQDYCEGPCQDRDQPGDLWIFGKVLENKSVYIKIKLASRGPLKFVRIISFHFAEYTLDYPFKEKQTDEEEVRENEEN
jgi:hypothetical protein